MPEHYVGSNKTIAKNTVMLYIRTIITTLIGLYSTRVVLNVLGVVDYGIYGLVGGIVAMFGFLNATMSGATSRFITFELGRGDDEKLYKTFSSAMIVHIFIAIIIVLICESFGVWWLNHKLVIPEERMNAAFWVLQLSIISTIVSITQVPYNATIIAHEAMSIYAYLDILNACLKLFIAYLISFSSWDRLILYASLILFVSISIRLFYRIYCHRHFEESRFRWTWDKDVLKPMVSFSWWDLYGNLSFSFRNQGVAFLINLFFGIIYNAASGLASTVSGCLMSFSSNVSVAIKPQIIKNYAENRNERVADLIIHGSKLSSFLFLIIGVPLFCFMDFVLDLWLVEVPNGTSLFCRLLLIVCLASLINQIVITGIHATGDIKRLSIISGSVFLLTLPIIWLGYKNGFSVFFAYIIEILSGWLVVLINAVILHKRIREFSITAFISNSIIPILLNIVISFLIVYVIESFISFSMIIELLSLTVSIIVCVIISFLLLSKQERSVFINLIPSFLKKN